MIYGIGTDIIQIARIEASLTRNGQRFAERILGAEELIEYQRRNAKVEERGLHYLCNRYAAKEAFSKALGLGMRPPVSWHAIQILNDEHGAPTITTNGELATYMQTHRLSAKVSVSDEKDYSVAFVLIEKTNHA